MNESNNDKTTEQAVNQLVADYLDEDIQQLLNTEPIEPSILPHHHQHQSSHRQS